ncbi:MAG TPA: patatin-like phospholipase family protein [Edaphobacter sp.]|nr:patatin-like phospholipase family protein [Edaphobacter sp.]
MAISPEQARDQKRLEQPPRDYCLRLAQEMKAFPRKHRLAEFHAEVVVEQTQVLSAALEDAWIKSFRHGDQTKRVDASETEEIADLLHAQPRVQASMATFVEYPPSKWLLEQELAARGEWHPDHPLEDVYLLAESRNLKGICFSGGGIRSATFNLGVLQGLAALDKLDSFDYLSTVSGGGYIHQFLASWISHDNLDKVQRLLQPLPSKHAERTLWPEPLRWLRRYSNYLTPQVGLFTADTWVAFAIWLRNTFLNQIVLIASILFVLVIPHWRINHAGATASELILHGGDAAIFVFICFAISSFFIWSQIGPVPTPQNGTQNGKKQGRGLKQGGVLGLVLLPLVIASFVVSPYLFRSAFWRGDTLKATDNTDKAVPCPVQFLKLPPGHSPAAPSSIEYVRQLHALALSCVPVPPPAGKPSATAAETNPEGTWILRTNGVDDLRQWWSAYSFHWWSPLERFNEEPSTSWVFVALLSGIGMLILAAGRALPRDWRAYILFLAIPGAMGAGYVFVGLSRIFVFASSFFLPVDEITRFNIAFLPTVALAIIFVSLEIGGGLVGNLVDESVREWFARLRAWSFLFGIAWFAIVGASLLGPRIAHDLFNMAYLGKPLVLGWMGTTLISVLAGKSSFTSGTSADKSSPLSRSLNALALIGPPIFIVGLTLILSFVVEKALTALETSLGQQSIPHPEFFMLLLILAATAAIFGWRIDINEFSLHAFYRDRLARCYAGASNPDRRSNHFTGFSAADKSIRLIDLLPAAFSKAPADLLPYDGAKNPKLPTYQGPFPIFCTTLNLSFGEDLAYQERKGTSFAFTPLYCGYDVGWTDADGKRVQFNGYTPTLNYAYYDGGPRMATAVAASGAAISPNWGYHSSPTMAFLLTIFNVRLGLWIRNPRRKTFLLPRLNGNPSSPAFGLFYLLAELFGMVNDAAAFVYLTDGGHFENMGLYELVRRHCLTIVICDAEQDGGLNFEGIGMAIRKCRIDCGAEINLDLSKLELIGEPPVSPCHSIMGTIRYPSGATGRILYIKTAYTEGLPADLINFHKKNHAFPNDTTMNQWFTESQFESYRRLGEGSVRSYPADQWLSTYLHSHHHANKT